MPPPKGHGAAPCPPHRRRAEVAGRRSVRRPDRARGSGSAARPRSVGGCCVVSAGCSGFVGLWVVRAGGVGCRDRRGPGLGGSGSAARWRSVGGCCVVSAGCPGFVGLGSRVVGPGGGRRGRGVLDRPKVGTQAPGEWIRGGSVLGGRLLRGVCRVSGVRWAGVAVVGPGAFGGCQGTGCRTARRSGPALEGADPWWVRARWAAVAWCRPGGGGCRAAAADLGPIGSGSQWVRARGRTLSAGCPGGSSGGGRGWSGWGRSAAAGASGAGTPGGRDPAPGERTCGASVLGGRLLRGVCQVSGARWAGVAEGWAGAWGGRRGRGVSDRPEVGTSRPGERVRGVRADGVGRARPGVRGGWCGGPLSRRRGR